MACTGKSETLSEGELEDARRVAEEIGRTLEPEFAAAAREHLTDLGFDHVTLALDSPDAS